MKAELRPATSEKKLNNEPIKALAQAFEMLLEMDKKANPKFYQKNYDDNRNSDNTD